MGVMNLDTWLTVKNIDENRPNKDPRRQKIIKAINKSILKHRWNCKSEAGSQLDWNQTLVSKINEANKYFEGSTIICSSEIFAIICSLEYFEPRQSEGSNDTICMGGVLKTSSGALNVIVDVFLPSPFLLIVREDFFSSDKLDCVIIYVDNIF